MTMTKTMTMRERERERERDQGEGLTEGCGQLPDDDREGTGHAIKILPTQRTVRLGARSWRTGVVALPLLGKCCLLSWSLGVVIVVIGGR